MSRTPVSDRARVAFLQQDSRIGGAEVNVLALVRCLDSRRFSPLVLCPEDGPLVDALKDAGCAVRLVSVPKLLPVSGRLFGRKIASPVACLWDVLAVLQAGRRLGVILAEESADLVYTNGAFSHLFGAIAASRARVPCVWHLQDIVSAGRAGGLFRGALCAVARRCSPSVMAISRPVAAVLDGQGVSVTVVPNGTPLLEPGNTGVRESIRHQLGIGSEAPLAAVVGRITPWKGQREFVAAAAQVYRECPDARFLVVGAPRAEDRWYLESVTSFADAAGVRDAIKFTGFHSNPAAIMRAIDLLVLPSQDPEPFGLVVIEAMAAGKPVVAPAHGGVVEIVEDGRSGLLVPPRDVTALAQAMLRILTNPEFARDLGARGREIVEERYSIDRFIQGVTAVFERALAGAR